MLMNLDKLFQPIDKTLYTIIRRILQAEYCLFSFHNLHFADK